MQAARSIVALWQGDEGYSQCGYLLLIRCRNSKRFGGSSLNGYSLRKTGSRRVRVCFLIPDDAGPGGVAVMGLSRRLRSSLRNFRQLDHLCWAALR